MRVWMDVMRDLESVLDDHERLFDAWAEGGVDGLVIGPLLFEASDLIKGAVAPPGSRPSVPTYDPNPAVYRRLDVEAPPTPEDRPEQRAQLIRTLEAAKDRGWEVWIFQAQTGAGPAGITRHRYDEPTIAACVARIIDTLEHYPMVDGAIMDGPEWGYEIAPHFMNRWSNIFDDLSDSVAPLCAELGYDYDALVAAKNRLYGSLHNLDPRRIAPRRDGGLLGGFNAFGNDPDLMAWLAFRVESLTAFFRGVLEGVAAEENRPVKLGVGPRSPAFAPLCGYDFVALAEFMDLLLPKHYFWHRGFDGMLGTIGRYVETICEWNPGLTDAHALGVVEALFGLALPGVDDRVDLESALTPEFFEQIVTREMERALAAVGDPDRVVPWVDAGRFPHDGDPMTSHHLKMMLEASESAGLRRFLYHHQGTLTAADWTVISDMCGTRWNPRTSDFQPADRLVL